MKNLPQIKIYDIDYDFIIKNYTSPELWDKKWNLFIFKNYIFTLELDSINVRKKRIYFDITLNSDLDIWHRNKNIQIMYDIKNMSINLLKEIINDNMLRLIELLEEEYIEAKDETYKYIDQSRDEEQERLREIAKEFLDDNGVTNREIRDVYIDYYVDNNETIWEQLKNYRASKKYTYLTDLYLIFAEVINDENLKKGIYSHQENDISEIENEVIKFMKHIESEEYTEEMQSRLEAI